MNRPYIICHMMTSLDGRIDCDMTGKLKGVEDYYTTLDMLDTPTTISGRNTAELELALPGKFVCTNDEKYAKEGFCKKISAKSYEVVVDTKGTLLWGENDADKPYLIITSEQVTKEYLAYLEGLNISWIACGKDRIDLNRAMEILASEFAVERVAVVGGGHINAGFLAANLLDEVSIVIGAGIDGRGQMAAVFDGLPMDREVTPLTLNSVKQFASQAVWLRYKVG